MKSSQKFMLALLLLLACNIFAQNQIWDGSADIDWYLSNMEATEYTLTTAEELAGVATIVNGGNNMSGKTIKLGADIVLNNTTDWKSWGTKAPTNTWIAIGTGYDYDNSFSGTFDGAGYVIYGVYINANNHEGLFGRNNGTIKNVGVINCYIYGGSYSGGLVGHNYGTVINSYYIGTVRSDAAAGLVGYNYGNGTVINSYSSGVVIGNYLGGLVYKNDGEVINSYYNKETSGQVDTGKGEGKTTSEMQSKNFVDLLNFTAGISSMNGWIYKQDEYPKLSKELASEINNIASYFAGGNGTEVNPYLIDTKEQLKNLSEFVNAGKTFSGEYFKLSNDINLNDTTGWENWGTKAPANSWTAIGNGSYSFKGIFNGAGYIISGVYINNAKDYQGLFGRSVGTIKNVGVVALYIKGITMHYVGGLAGSNSGTISNSYSTGIVNGSYVVGGLVGSNYGTISNSYSIGTVSNASKNNGYSNYVGGLVGYNTIGTISNCYSIGTINSDNNDVGGLVGYNDYDGVVNNSYYDAQNSGRFDTGKGTGKATADMKSQDTYIDWDFEYIWNIGTEVNNGYPYLLMLENIPSSSSSSTPEPSSSSSKPEQSSSSHDDEKVLCKINGHELELSEEDCELAGGSIIKDKPSSSSSEDGKAICKVGELELELSEEDCELAGGSIIEDGETPIISQFTDMGSLRVIAVGNNLVFGNLPSNAKISVYNTRGQKQGTTNLAKGLYMVKVNSTIFKVPVK